MTTNRGRTSRGGHWPGGSTRAWAKIRAYVLERDAYVCQLRIPDTCTHTATQAHHTRDRNVYGDDPAHIIATCAPCNIRVGNPTITDPDPNPTW